MDVKFLNPFIQAAVEVLKTEVDANAIRGDISMHKSALRKPLLLQRQFDSSVQVRNSGLRCRQRASSAMFAIIHLKRSC